MANMVFFTNDSQDHSTREGYQFEFFCQRGGNGYSSSFQHSVTGFGGRLLKMGGDLLGGEVGQKAAQLGWDAEWLRDGNRGSTRDKALAKAAGVSSGQPAQPQEPGGGLEPRRELPRHRGPQVP